MVSGGTFDGVNIIHEVSINVYDDGYGVSYSTNRGAWIDHKDCTLLSGPTQESMLELASTLREDHYEDSL